MERQIHEPAWRIGAKRALRAAGRIMPVNVRLAVVHKRPALTWIVPPGRIVRYDRYLDLFTIEVDTNSKIERQMLSGVYEPHLLRILREYIKPGMTSLDVGANVGAMTLAMAQCAGPAGCVHAFEPAAHLYQRLCRNRDLNPAFGCVMHAHNIALGANPGDLYWLESSAGPGNGRLIDHDVPGAMRVTVTTLDRWRAESNVDRIDFIKVDVERMELAVVRGGIDTLQRLRPTLLLETLPCRGRAELERPTRELLELLRELGYELFSAGKRELTPILPGGLPSAYETLALPR